MRPSEKRKAVTYLKRQWELSTRRACEMLNQSLSVYYYTPKKKNDDLICEVLSKLAEENPRWGFWKMYDWIRHKGHRWNHKRVRRVYLSMGLNIRRRHKKRLPSRIKEPLVLPIGPNITWSIDFMHDTLTNGCKFRTLNVIDDYNRESLTITIDTSLSSKRVIRELDRIIAWRGKPMKIRCDNGPEFTSSAFEHWANNRDIELSFIQKGKPSQNGYIERFNRTYREEILGAYLFESLKQVCELTEQWIWKYNNERPHDALGKVPPTHFASQHGHQTPTILNNLNLKQNLQ